MKKCWTYLFCSLLFAQVSFGQRLIFTNPFGGQHYNGGITSYDFSSGKLTTPISVPGNPLGLVDGWLLYDSKGYFNGNDNSPYGDNHRKENGLYAASDGYVYGLDQFASAFYGNVVGNALLYRFRPDSLKIEVMHNFNGLLQDITELPVGAYKNALSKPRFGMIEGISGVLYGICIEGGLYGYGGIWKYEINKRKFSQVSDFNPNTLGYYPNGPLFKAFDNQIYGSLSFQNGSNSDGHLYQVLTDKDTVIYANSLKMTGSGYASVRPNGPVAYDPGNHELYGARLSFSFQSSLGGGLYSLNFDTKTVHNLNEIMTNNSLLGSSLVGIVRGNNGAYYGVTEYKGVSGKGTLLMVKNPREGSADFVKVADFSESPAGNSIIAVADKIFGTYLDYGVSNKGIWCYNLSTGLLTDVLPGGNSIGYGVQPHLAVIGNTIYARTIFGGKNNAGGIVAISALSLEVTSLIQAYEPTGKSAVGELLAIGNNEYLGFSHTGGDLTDNYRNLGGSILRYDLTKKTVNSVASIRTISKNELDAVGLIADAQAFKNYPLTYNPYGMFKGMNGKIYFSIHTYEVPWYPYLYQQYRASNRFCEFDLATNSIKELAKFVNTDANQPLEITAGKFLMKGYDSLIVYDLATGTSTSVQVMPDATIVGSMQGKWLRASNGLIYGTTSIEKLNTSSKTYLYSLDPANNFKFSPLFILANANQANIGLTEVGGKIYGSTATGGTNNHGFIFSFDLTTSLYKEEYAFSAGIDGANFSAGWTLNNGKLYSTSQAGGANGYGTIVEFDPAIVKLKVLSDLTIQNGNGIFATPIFPIYPTIADSTDIIVKDTIICSSNSAELTASSATVSNPVFKWYSDSTLTTLIYTGETYTTPALLTTSRYFVAVSSSDVLQNPSGNGKKVTVTVNATPIMPVISSNKQSFCLGDSALLTSNTSIGNQWYKDGNVLTGATLASLKVMVTGNYSVKITSAANCKSTMSTVIAITATTMPNAPIIHTDKQSFCAGEVATLISNTPNGNQWYKDGMIIVGAIAASYNATVSGSYATTASSSLNCISNLSNVLAITSNTIPTAPKVVVDGDTKICKDESRNLTIVIPTNTLSQWYKNGTIIAGSTSANLLVTEQGTYTNKLSNGTCVSASSNGITIEVVCTTSIVMPDVFTPNGDGFNDKLYAIVPGLRYLRTYEIYNRIGNMVFSTVDKDKAWDGTLRGAQQPADSYIWIIEGVDGKGNTIKKTGVITLIR